MSLRQRAYRFADGREPCSALAARPIITAESYWRQARNVAVRTLRARAASRPGHLSPDAGAGCRDQDAARRPGRAARQVPAGRLGQPSQVTDLPAAILAKAYLTNQVIFLDGGIYPR
jgi:hypothetical protein